MGKHNKTKNRELQYQPKDTQEKSIQETVETTFCGIIIHKSRIESAPEAFMTRGVLSDVQEKFLTLLEGVDENTSIAIVLSHVPSNFKFPIGDKNVEDDQESKSEDVLDDNSEPDGNGTESVNTQEDGSDEKVAELNLDNAPDPFDGIENKP